MQTTNKNKTSFLWYLLPIALIVAAVALFLFGLYRMEHARNLPAAPIQIGTIQKVDLTANIQYDIYLELPSESPSPSLPVNNLVFQFTAAKTGQSFPSVPPQHYFSFSYHHDHIYSTYVGHISAPRGKYTVDLPQGLPGFENNFVLRPHSVLVTTKQFSTFSLLASVLLGIGFIILFILLFLRGFKPQKLFRT